MNNIEKLQAQIAELKEQTQKVEELLLHQLSIEKILEDSIKVENNLLKEVVLYKLATISPEDRYLLVFDLNGVQYKIQIEVPGSIMNLSTFMAERVNEEISQKLFKELSSILVIKNIS